MLHRDDRHQGSPHHQTRRLKFGCHIGEFELQGLKVGETLAELLALLHVVARQLETLTCRTDGA